MARKKAGGPQSGVWSLAQATSVCVAVGVVALLLLRPEAGLFVTWSVLIPLVPALLLLAPQLWRNLCPIAVVHQLPVRVGRGGSRRLPAAVQRRAPAVAAALLFLIVPLRLVVFNEHGPALAVFVLAVLAVALAGGLAVTGKGGWCATFCPVLPVERLYGQSPVIAGPHAHCATCTGCLRSCYDLKPERSMEELITPPGRSAATAVPGVLGSPTGVFASAFPGFVAGYFTCPAGSGIPGTYIWIGTWAVASLIWTAAAQRLLGAGSGSTVRVAAAVAAAFYYWFTVPSVAAAAHEVLGVATAPGWVIGTARAAALLLVGTWWARSVRPLRSALAE